MEPTYLRFRVWLRSAPGPHEQYDGYVDVAAQDHLGAFENAVNKLRRTTFPERGFGMWRLVKIEEVYPS